MNSDTSWSRPAWKGLPSPQNSAATGKIGGSLSVGDPNPCHCISPYVFGSATSSIIPSESSAWKANSFCAVVHALYSRDCTR